MNRCYFLYHPNGEDMLASVHVFADRSVGVWCRNPLLGVDYEGPQVHGEEPRQMAADFIRRAREEGVRIVRDAYPAGQPIASP